MKKVIEFETRIARFSEPDEDKRDEEKAYHLFSISELQNLAPFVRELIRNSIYVYSPILLRNTKKQLLLLQIQWNHYFNAAFRLVDRKITNKENVVVYSPSFIANLSLLINEYSNSPENKT